MLQTARHILLAVLAVALVIGCHRGGRVIPANDLVDIYADMFIADQWVKTHNDARKKADTTLFYEPIFRKYGYTTKDYDATVSYYVDRPDKYSKIIQKSAANLNRAYLEYNKISERLNKVREANSTDYGYVTSGFLNADSILLGPTVLDSILVRDSLYIKPEIVDTLATRDSLANSDSIEKTIKTENHNASRRDSLRTHKKPTPGKLPWHKPAADARKDL